MDRTSAFRRSAGAFLAALFAGGQAFAAMTVDPAALKPPPENVIRSSMRMLYRTADAGEQAGAVVDGAPERSTAGAVQGAEGLKKSESGAAGEPAAGSLAVPLPKAGVAGLLSLEQDCGGFLPCLGKAGVAIVMVPFVSTITGLAIGASLGESAAGGLGAFVGKGLGGLLGLVFGLCLMPFAVGVNLVKAVAAPFKKKPEEKK